MSESVIAEHVVKIVPGKEIEMQGEVPKHAEFFQDHFPDFPILPGVLAVELLRQAVEKCLQEETGDRGLIGRITELRAVKFASYLKPGDAWQSKCTLMTKDGKNSTWKAQLFSDGKSAVSAKLDIAEIDKK